jgi:hypothetical protein
MAIHAPPVQPAAAPHHVDRGLVALLAGLVVVVAAFAWLASGYRIEIVAPATGSEAAEAMIVHRASERASLYPSSDEYLIDHRASERESLQPSAAQFLIDHRASERASR